MATVGNRAWIAIAALGLLAAPAYATAQKGSSHAAVQKTATVKRPDFARAQASPDVRHIADWVADSGDNSGLPFAIIDKTNARVFVFEPDGAFRGASPVLLGLARGDHTVPGIGEREMSLIRPDERTTPAGRFVAERGKNMDGEDIIWIDYDAAVSMHRVRAKKPRERRLERLASPTPADNRISYGCVNVPVKFYNNVIDRTFASATAVVYVLPETRAAHDVFGSYEVSPRERSSARAARPQIVRDDTPR